MKGTIRDLMLGSFKEYGVGNEMYSIGQSSHTFSRAGSHHP